MNVSIERGRGRECRCTQCNSLLGVRHGPRVHVKYKDLSIIGHAPMTVECRRCKTSNDVNASSAI